MNKRLFFLVITFISAVAANADKDIIQGILQYHCFDENMTAEVRLSDYNDTQEVDVVIPEQIEERPIRSPLLPTMLSHIQ